MKKVFAFLTALMLMCMPVMASGSEAAHGHGLAEVPLWLCLPFAGILLSIAVFPLVKPHWWEEHQPVVVALWSVLFLVPFAALGGVGGAVEIVLECIINDYLTFIVLLFGLFCVAGNITLEGDLAGSPRVNVVLLLFSLIFDRHYIGLATFINLFLLGYVVDFSHNTLLTIFPDASMPIRCVSFVIGFVALCFSSSLYMTADLGVSTYDAVAIIMANTWKLGQFKYIRIVTDLCCVIIGCSLYLLGGGALAAIPTIAGFGTIVTAFFMGPLIDWFNRKFSIPFLEKSK